jgi:chromate reductase
MRGAPHRSDSRCARNWFSTAGSYPKSSCRAPGWGRWQDPCGDLPHFNPDLDGDTVAHAVKNWRCRLLAADGVVFSVPEYAHGVPGTLKNGLDWVVGSNELAGKPVALFHASARGTYAQAWLTETLTVMSAQVVSVASITLQLLGKSASASQIAADPGMSAALRSGIEAFAFAINAGRAMRKDPWGSRE